MEMCYSGVLVMPSSYAVMDEVEMTYLEGGATYVRDALIVAASYDQASENAKALAGLALVSATVAGAYVGGSIGALIGAIGGMIAGSVMWGWSASCSMASVEASRYSGKIHVTEDMINGDLVITIRKY